jgi:predicted Fe-Mo cluster-binding NifX family protein
VDGRQKQAALGGAKRLGVKVYSGVGAIGGIPMSAFRNAVATVLLVMGVTGGLTAWAAETAKTPAPGEQTAGAQAPRKELFAIAAEGKEATAQIPYLAARATHYHVYAENGALVETLPNTFLNLEAGVGPAAAQMLAEHGVTVLVAGMVGPKMKDVLVANKMRFVSRKGKVQDVVNELKKSQ